jgi:hypothetical protein
VYLEGKPSVCRHLVPTPTLALNTVYQTYRKFGGLGPLLVGWCWGKVAADGEAAIEAVVSSDLAQLAVVIGVQELLYQTV